MTTSRGRLLAACSVAVGLAAGLVLVETLARFARLLGGRHPGGKASRFDFGAGPVRPVTQRPPAGGVWRVPAPPPATDPAAIAPAPTPPTRRTCSRRYWGSLGHRPSVPVPNSGRHRCVLEDARGRVIYDVTYTIDRFGRRVPTIPGSPSPRPEYLLLLGCSVAYGQGLRDGDALASLLGEKRPHQHPVSYAFSGYGPASVLLRLQRSNLRSAIPAASGTVVYLFIDDHVRRTIGTMGIVATWGRRLPYAVLSGSGRPVVRGTFRTGRELRTALYRLLYPSAVFDVTGVDLPPWLGDGGARLVVGLLSAIREEVQAQLGSHRFFVVFFPGSRSADRLAPLLRGAGLATIDYSATSLQGFTAQPAAIPLDGHPSAPAMRALGVDLAERLTMMEAEGFGA